MMTIVIPAFDPPADLAVLVADLAGRSEVDRIIVVDDGSGVAAAPVFGRVQQTPRTTLLRHAVNRGKGAALKTAFQHVLADEPTIATIVTADADGQHLPDDIVRVGRTGQAHPDALVLGVRAMGPDAPLRSRLGNGVTRQLFAWLVGQRLRDTQTGLRALPLTRLAECCALPGTGYDYELHVLIHCRQATVRTLEVPIATVYRHDNRHSHFHPVRDSWRVYAALLRFAAVSAVTATVDNLVFIAASAAGATPGMALVAARTLAAAWNYPVAKRWVFREVARHLPTLGPYLLLVVINACLARLAIHLLSGVGGVDAVGAKMAWETLFFFPSFLLQRDLVFRANAAPTDSTDWTTYYERVPVTARLTRRYTGRRLVQALARASRLCGPLPHIVELGGAASCFVDRVCRHLRPSRYTVVDSNAAGLARLEAWQPPPGASTSMDLLLRDARDLEAAPAADTAFSVGLIEHFDEAGTRQVLDAHLALVRPGGAVVVSYPTPTWVYRVTRRLLEGLRLWHFPDERPLRFAEVEAALAGRATVVHRQMLWPLLLTQEMVVCVKHREV